MNIFSFIKSKLSIVDVVLEYTNIRPVGHYHKGMCIFHSEKDASFTVSPDKGIFYCFGCHAGGDVIAFIARAENLTQIEAVQHLIDRYDITVPEEVRGDMEKSTLHTSEKNWYYQVCEKVAMHFHTQLLASDKPRIYLEKRGITETLMKTFNLGYFKGGPRSVNALMTAMGTHNVLRKDLHEVGVISESSSGSVFSPFEERIVFPIYDALGRCIGFGGRVYKQRDDRAKYYNSKESPFFAKGQVLFNYHRAKQSMRQKDWGFLVEGYTDCIAMVAHGYDHTVATLGTACTVDHLRLLSRSLSTLYVLYDGDAAGQKAILRLVELCWEVNIELKIISLPAEDDPASYLERYGSLDEEVTRAQDIFSFFVDTHGTGFAQKSLSEKMERAQKIVSVIGRLSDPFKRDLLMQHAANIMKLPRESLKKLMARVDRGATVSASQKFHDTEPDQDDDEQSWERRLEKTLLFAIINTMERDNGWEISEDIRPYLSQRVRDIGEKVEKIRSSVEPAKRFAVFYDSLGASDQQWVSRHSLKYSDEISPQEFAQIQRQFYKLKWKTAVQDIKDQIIEAQKRADYDLVKDLTKRFVKLSGKAKDKGLI